MHTATASEILQVTLLGCRVTMRLIREAEPAHGWVTPAGPRMPALEGDTRGEEGGGGRDGKGIKTQGVDRDTLCWSSWPGQTFHRLTLSPRRPASLCMSARTQHAKEQSHRPVMNKGMDVKGRDPGGMPNAVKKHKTSGRQQPP